MPTHEEFGELKRRFSLHNNDLIEPNLMSEMRENLIQRNGGNTYLCTYATKRILDLELCNIEELYEADASLFHYGH